MSIRQGSEKFSSSSRHRLVAVRRIIASSASFISPVERWADENYTPQALEYVYTQHSEYGEIAVPLHGFAPQDVQVDISRQHMLILFSHIGEKVYPTRQEFYCEVPLPPDVQQTEALVMFSGHFLIARLAMRQPAYKRVLTMGGAFRNGLAVLFGKTWNFGRFDY